MLIYSKISTLMSITLIINNYLDNAAPRSLLLLIVLCVDSNIMNKIMCDLEPDIIMTKLADCHTTVFLYKSSGHTMETAILDLCK